MTCRTLLLAIDNAGGWVAGICSIAAFSFEHWIAGLALFLLAILGWVSAQRGYKS